MERSTVPALGRQDVIFAILVAAAVAALAACGFGSACPERSPGWAFAGVVGLLVLVVARSRVGEDRRARTELLQTIIDNLPGGVTVFDRDLKMLACNRRVIELLDFPPAMFAGRLPSFEELSRFNAERGEYGAGDVEVLVAERLARARRSEPHRFERTRPNGTTLEVRGAPLPDGGFVSIYTDVTARVAAESELRRQAVYLKSVVDHLPQGISVFDDELRLKCWNEVLLEVLELPPEAVRPDVSFDELLMYPARRGEYGPGDPLEQVRQRRELAVRFQPHRFERTRPNGRTHLVEGRPMQVDGRVFGFVTSYTDITDRKAAEESLRARTVLLDAIVDNMPGGISVFDGKLRLALYNDEVLRLLDIPPAFAASKPDFEAVVRYNIERGEYGPVDDLESKVEEMMVLARHPVRHRIERLRRDGTAVEIRGAPLPDGGFVTIYSDITERHRIEDALRLRTAYLQAILDQLPQGVSVFDATLHLQHWNLKFIEVLELPDGLVQRGVAFDELVRVPAQRGEYGPGDVDALVRQRRELALRFEPHRFERTRPNGRTHLIEGKPMLLDGAVAGFITTYTDITDRIADEDELRRRNAVFQTLIENIPGGVTLFDADFRLVASNREYRRLLDFPDELFESAPRLDDFFRFNAARGEYGSVDAEAKVRELLERARMRQPHLFERTRPNGTVLEIRGLPLSDGGFVTIYTDVTEHRVAAEAIERLAHRDSLTGLANRHTLEARLDQSVADAGRHGRKLAVLFIDLDNFKQINDSLGHAVGDEYLIEIARRLNAGVRESDIVARLGGDEFVLVITGVNEVEAVGSVAAKLLETIARPVQVSGQDLVSTASIGVCVFPDDGDSRLLLMKNADIAMYSAKTAGRAGYQFFSPSMTAAATERLNMEADLRRAIEQGELVLHYQAQIDMKTQRQVGCEALIRWQRAGELVPPMRFIPLAEASQLINAIGEWALREACFAMQRWRRAGWPDQRIAVNLSARQLKKPGLLAIVEAALADSGLPAELLELEITESAAMENPQVTIENLRALKRLGVHIAIDDFGTGYSSLAYLKLLPIDCLKLDRAFVKDLEHDSNDAAICKATIGLAHSLGLSVLAEGVETPAQFDYLRSLGCDLAQGFLFSRPLAEEALLESALARAADAAEQDWSI